MLLLCAGIFPFLKSIVQIALSLHKTAINIVQTIMNEAFSVKVTNCPPTPPSKNVFVMSFPFSSTLASN